MQPQSLEWLVEERVAQLEAISKRRNELLRQMYLMMKKRRNFWTVLDVDEEEDENEDLYVFLEKYDLQKNPQGGVFADVPQNEIFAPPSPLERHRTTSPDDDEDARVDVQSDSPKRPATPIEVVPSITRASASLDGLANYSSSPPRLESDETPMQVDESPEVIPSPPQILYGEEPESDDILLIEPAEGQSPRAPSVSLSRQHVVDDDDDRDELDIIGSLSPSHSTSETSVEPCAQTTMQESSRAVSQTADTAVSRGISFSPRLLPDEHEYSDVDIGAGEPDERESVEDEVPKGIIYQASPERETTPDLMLMHPESENHDMASPPSQVFQQPLVHSVAVEVPHRQTSIYIRAPSSPIPGLPDYNFNLEPVTEPVPISSQHSPKQQRHHFNPIYNLPPLKALPVEFNRKLKSTKGQRRREKEREKNERGSERGDYKRESRDEWLPMGINKWGATVRANPVYKKVSRASKCLSTREWNVSWAELRLIRTLERIELMKDAGRWSLRQPKKQRGTGGLTKTHRDYLMDEMKWMRTDFREERKWKMALAYNLSTAVLEWHAAGSLEERLKRKICVLWKRPRDEELNGYHEKDGGFEQMDVDDNAEDQTVPNIMVDYNSSDNDDDEAVSEQKDVTDALDLSTAVQEALDGIDAAASRDGDLQQTGERNHVEPKVEERDDLSALRGVGSNVQGDLMDVDGVALQDSQPSSNGEESVSKLEEGPGTSIPHGLKPTSADPILASVSNTPPVNAEVSSSTSKAIIKSNIYAPLREHIAYSDENKLFVDLDDYDNFVEHLAALSTADTTLEAPPPPPDLSAIFPDLQPFGLLNVPPVPTSTSTDAKKKPDRKSDRDDPNKRVEDTSYTKLVPLGEFMYCKPTLIGPLKPAKSWRKGKWLIQEDTASNSENDAPAVNEYFCDLFGGTRSSSSEKILPPREPKDARRRIMDQLWTPSDDMLLKTSAERYPNNWPLIADAFNSSRVTISIDHRIPWDCYERWSSRWGGGSSLAKDIMETSSTATFDGATPSPVPPLRDQMTTRGIKRLASVSVGANTSPGGSINEPKKRRRHNLMFDAIRKAAKKREQNQKLNAAQKKSQAMHDTHGQYNKMPRYTPAELSRMKSDRDQKEQEQLNFVRQRQELQRQQQMLQQANRMPMAQQAQMLQQQQQQPNGIGRPSGTVIPTSQNAPQIRNQVNISQQQRIPNNMGASNTRLSPQQMLHVQAQAAQARAIQVAAAQAQAAQNIAANITGMGPSINNSHLSPPYNNRATTSSPMPHSSPPHPSAVLSNATSSPRPPSAQAHGNMGPAPQVPGNVMSRQAGNMGHFFPMVPNMQNMQSMQSMPGANFTQEQMDHAIRLQTLVQARQGGMSQGQNSSYPSQP